MWHEQINSFAEFLTINPKLFHNVVSILIYLAMLWVALKSGSSWVVFLVGYLVISLVLTFIGIDSYLNVATILRDLIESIFGIDEGSRLGRLWKRIFGR